MNMLIRTSSHRAARPADVPRSRCAAAASRRSDSHLIDKRAVSGRSSAFGLGIERPRRRRDAVTVHFTPYIAATQTPTSAVVCTSALPTAIGVVQAALASSSSSEAAGAPPDSSHAEMNASVCSVLHPSRCDATWAQGESPTVHAPSVTSATTNQRGCIHGTGASVVPARRAISARITPGRGPDAPPGGRYCSPAGWGSCHYQAGCMSWMRFPQVSSRMAMTEPVTFVGSFVNVTPRPLSRS